MVCEKIDIDDKTDRSQAGGAGVIINSPTLSASDSVRNNVIFDEFEQCSEFHVNDNESSKDGNLTLKDKNAQPLSTIDIIKGCITITLLTLNVPALVDTGATICCMSLRIFNSLYGRSGCKIVMKKVRYKVFLADGSVSHVKNVASIPFKIGTQTFTQDFALLPSLNKPVIFGTNFLKRHKALIDFSTHNESDNHPIRAVRSVTIPPFCDKAVTGEIIGMENMGGQQGVTFNLCREVPTTFIVNKSNVIPNDNNRTPIIIWNTSSSPLKIQKGMILGIFKPVTEDDFVTKDSKNTENQTIQSISAKRVAKAETFNDYLLEEDDEYDSGDEFLPEQLNHLRSEAHDADIDKVKNTKPKVILSDKGKVKLGKMLDSYDDCFVGENGELGLSKLYEHTIHIKPDTPPIHLLPFRTTPEKASEFDDMCQDLVSKNILEETTQGSWANRSFRVHKADGGLRLVTDLRYVNANMINQALISPRMDDSLEMIGDFNPKVFSKLDAASGFFQIPLAPESRKYTAFLSHDKKYQYKVLPMGLSTSPQAFCALVTMIFNKLKGKCVIPYLDDLLVLSQSEEQHFEDLESVFKALRQANLKLKRKKCEFFLDRIEFLGMVVSPQGIQPCPTKIASLKEFKRPKTITQVRSFNGLCQFFKRFIKNFSEIIRPLYDLTRKDHAFKWTNECEKSFETLKNSIC